MNREKPQNTIKTEQKIQSRKEKIKEPIESIKQSSWRRHNNKPEVSLQKLLRIMNKALKKEAPEEWLFKTEDSKECRNYKGIIYTITVAKIYVTILEKRKKDEKV